MVCPDKKAGEILKTSLHDFEGDKTYTEKLGHNFPLKKSFADVKPADYDAVYVAGGRGPEYIRIDKRVQEIIRHFHKNDKPIFTICHGVQVLMAVPETIRGKEVAALQYCEPEVTAVGGKYIDVPPTGAHVDGKLVSAKGWPGLAAFMKNCLQVLGTEIRHGEIAPAKAEAKRRLATAASSTRSPASGWGTGVGYLPRALRSTPHQTLSLPAGGGIQSGTPPLEAPQDQPQPPRHPCGIEWPRSWRR